MLSPLADRSCLLVLAHLRRCREYEPQSHFHARALFWAAISQLCVHDGAVLSFMMDQEAAALCSEAGGPGSFECFQSQAAQWFDHAMNDLGLNSSMTSGLSQPVLHLLGKTLPKNETDKRTHRFMVQNFIQRFDFSACARELVRAGNHEKRKLVLQRHFGNVHLRIISVLRLLEAGPFEKWNGAWNDLYIGRGAAPVCEGVSSDDFREHVLAQVTQAAPTWLLSKLDELPLRLDSIQGFQHFRCEARKITGRRRLPRYRLAYKGYHERRYRMLFQRAAEALKENRKNHHALVERLSVQCRRLSKS